MKHITAFLAAFVLTGGLLSAADRIEKPKVSGFRVAVPTYGDQAVLDNMARLLAEEDPTTRERIASELGETHNPQAIGLIRHAAQDPDPRVVAAAYQGAADLDTRAARDLILEGIRDDKPLPRLSAIHAAGRLGMTEAAEALRAAADAPQTMVRAAALKALSDLGRPAKEESIRAALASGKVPLQLAAATNAQLAESTQSLRDALAPLAATTVRPEVRGQAIAALAALNAPNRSALLAAAMEDDDARVRLGAVRGYRLAKMGAQAQAGLKDFSALVRREALAAAVQFPLPENADLVTQLLLRTPDPRDHAAARDALLALGAPHAPKALAAKSALAADFDRVQAMLRAEDNENVANHSELTQLQRNLATGAEILRALRDPAANDLLIRIVSESDIDAPYLDEAALALAAMDDQRATTPIAARLQVVDQRIMPYLISQVSLQPSQPFSEEVAGGLCRAAIQLKMTGQIPLILKFSRCGLPKLRPFVLTAHIASILPALHALAENNDKQKVLDLTFDMLDSTEPSFGLASQQYASLAAVQLDVRKATGPLGRILAEDRVALETMRVAAWALQEITGETPEIGEPKRREGIWAITILKH